MWKLINIDRNSVIIKYIDSRLLKVTKLAISCETIRLNKVTQFKMIQWSINIIITNENDLINK